MTWVTWRLLLLVLLLPIAQAAWLTQLTSSLLKWLPYTYKEVTSPVLESLSVTWGIPDTQALVGNVFMLPIPAQAFSRKDVQFEVHEAGSISLPRWMYFDHTTATFYGVPTPLDQGSVLIEVIASTRPKNEDRKDDLSSKLHAKSETTLQQIDVATQRSEQTVQMQNGRRQGSVSTAFLIQVKTEKSQTVVPFSDDMDIALHLNGANTNAMHETKPRWCKRGENEVRTTLILGLDLLKVSPQEKVELLYNMAAFVSRPLRELRLGPKRSETVTKLLNTHILLAGPGENRTSPTLPLAELSWTVACGDFTQTADIAQVMAHNIASGRLRKELNGLLVLGWHISQSMPPGEVSRKRRAVRGTATPSIYSSLPTKIPGLPTSYISDLPVPSQTSIPTSDIVPTLSSEILPTETQSMMAPSSSIPADSSDLATIIPSTSSSAAIATELLTSFPDSSLSYSTDYVLSSMDMSSISDSTFESSFTFMTPSLPFTDGLFTSSSDSLFWSMSESIEASIFPTGSIPMSTESIIVPTDTLMMSEIKTEVPVASSTFGTEMFQPTASLNISETLVPTQTFDASSFLIQSTESAFPTVSSSFILPTSTYIFTSSEVTTSTITSAHGTTDVTTDQQTTEEVTSEATTFRITEVSTVETTPSPITTQQSITNATISDKATTEQITTEIVDTTFEPDVTTEESGFSTSSLEMTSNPMTTEETGTEQTTFSYTTENDVTTPEEFFTTEPSKTTSGRTTEAITTQKSTIPVTTSSGYSAEITTQERTTLKITTSEQQVTTQHLTSLERTTQEATTFESTTKQQTTLETTTQETTFEMTTEQPTTLERSTQEMTTEQPTTSETNMREVTTVEKTTARQPTTSEVTTQDALVITSEGTTPQQTTESDTAVGRTTEGPTTQAEIMTTEMTTTERQTTEIFTSKPITTSQSTPEVTTTVELTTQKTLTTSGPNSPPELKNPIDRIGTKIGTYFEYNVPNDTFYDSEDGFTPNLHLTMFTINNENLTKDSWVQFDSRTQTVYGIPLVKDVTNPASVFFIQATDSGGLTAKDAFEIVIDESITMEVSHSYYSKFNLDYANFMLDTENIVGMVTRISEYFGDDPRIGYIAVNSITNGSVDLTWSNSSIAKDYCDNDTILEQLSMIQTEYNGVKIVNTAYWRAMQPDYPVEQVGFQWLGACVIEANETEPTAAPSVPDEEGVTLWLAIFLPILIAVIILLIIIICCLYHRRQKELAGRWMLEDEKPIFGYNRKPVFMEHELEMQDSIRKPRKPVLLSTDNEAPFAYANSGYTPDLEQQRRPPPEYGLRPPSRAASHDTDGADSPDYGASTSSESPPPEYFMNTPYQRPPPTYRVPPPYLPFTGSSEI